MPGPATYTGEDVAEIHGHGGPVVLGRILELVLAQGARLAQPGEFTRRAFLNNRMDLSQAEAVVDLIHARSTLAARVAAAHVGGGLRQEVEKILDTLIQCRAHIEAALDFSDDTGEGDTGPILEFMSQGIFPALQALVANSELGKAYTQGLNVAIVGRPNVGKSSLMNALAGEERSIVTNIPGTTRDVIREAVLIHGFQFVLADTAGLRNSLDPVEMAGVEKAWAAMEQSDIILLVTEAGPALPPQDLDLLARARETGRPIILVANKQDLFIPTRPLSIPGLDTVLTSAKTGEGLDNLRHKLEQALHLPDTQENLPGIVPNLRQKQALERALGHVRAGQDRMEETAWELAALDLEAAQQSLEEVMGTGASPSILDAIFSRFCIGK